MTRERLSTYEPSAIATVDMIGTQKTQVDRERLIGVVQTGRVVRALYGGHSYGHTAEHVLVSYRLNEGRLAFASDWPRWVVLEQRPEAEMTVGKPTARWTSFILTLFQPPEAQLAALEANN